MTRLPALSGRAVLAALQRKGYIRTQPGRGGRRFAGWIPVAQGDLVGARPYYERALAILEKRLGPNHPTTKVARGNLESLPAPG